MSSSNNIKQSKLDAKICDFLASIKSHGDKIEALKSGANAMMENNTKMQEKEKLETSNISASLFTLRSKIQNRLQEIEDQKQLFIQSRDHLIHELDVIRNFVTVISDRINNVELYHRFQNDQTAGTVQPPMQLLPSPPMHVQPLQPSTRRHEALTVEVSSSVVHCPNCNTDLGIIVVKNSA